MTQCVLIIIKHTTLHVPSSVLVTLDARNLERLDQLYEAEKKRLLGADFGQQIVADEVQAKWPEMEAGVQAVLLATDGSRISEHPEDAKPSAGADFAAFRGVGFQSDSNPLTGKLRVSWQG